MGKHLRLSSAIALGLLLPFCSPGHAEAQVSDTDRAKAFFFQAEANFSEGKYDAAEEQLDKAEELFGRKTPTLLALDIQILDKQGDLDALKVSLDKFYSLNPPPSDALIRTVSPILASYETSIEEKRKRSRVLASIDVEKNAGEYAARWTRIFKMKLPLFIERFAIINRHTVNRSDGSKVRYGVYKTDVNIESISCNSATSDIQIRAKLRGETAQVGRSQSTGSWRDMGRVTINIDRSNAISRANTAVSEISFSDNFSGEDYMRKEIRDYHFGFENENKIDLSNKEERLSIEKDHDLFSQVANSLLCDNISQG